MRDEIEHEDLKQETGHIIEEARMVLPGLQALFGFQTIAVFNDKFDGLPYELRLLHLAALLLSVLAIALLMAPAAFHRIAEAGEVSRQLARIASMLICSALVPLMISLCLDVFIVASLVTQAGEWSAALAIAAFAVFLILWFIAPLYLRMRRRI